ncbi:MAG: glycosyltransferase [Cyanobacteria bacterium J06621_11]
MKKKVCITTLEFPPDIGGVGQSVSRISQMLIALGYDVHIVVFRAVFRAERAMAENEQFRASMCQTIQQDGRTVHRLSPAVRSPDAKKQDYLCDLYDQLKTLHRTYQFDLLHAFFINEMGFLTTLLAKENNLPVINSVRGADLNKHSFDPAQLSQIIWTLTHSTWTTFVSKDLMQRARALVPQIQPRSSAFWNSIVPFSFNDLSKPTLVDHLWGTIIGSVGSFRDKKGLENLLAACELLDAEHEITLLLVGDFAEKERGYWQQMLAQSSFSDRVLVTGKLSRQEAIAYLPHIDIFAIPSLRDGCPNALLEAMLAARAIVGSQVDAIGEIIEDGCDGLTVPPSDTTALSHVIEHLINQPDLRQQLGIAARKKALTQLAPNVEQQNWSAVYQLALETQLGPHLEIRSLYSKTSLAAPTKSTSAYLASSAKMIPKKDSHKYTSFSPFSTLNLLGTGFPD